MPDEQVTHAVSLDLADGRRFRFGPDERDVGNVPVSLSFDTELPGGFSTASITLPRPDILTAMDARLFASTRIYDAMSNMGFHEGRVTGVPQVGPSQIEIQVEGWVKHLEDDQTARAIFYDRDFSSWGEPSVQRQINLITGGYGLGNVGATPDPVTGSQALAEGFDGSWAGNIIGEGWYDAGGLSVSYLDYAWKKSSTVLNADPNWGWAAQLADDDLNTTVDATANLRAAGPGSGTVSATGTRKFVNVQHYYTGLGGAEGSTYTIYWTLLGVVGNHGITLQGSVSAPNTGRGVLGSDVAAYTVGRWAPLLNYSTGSLGSIEPTSFVIPHLTYPDDTTALAILENIVLLGGSASLPLDYGVYEDQTFFMRTPGTYGKTWRVRKDQATESTDSGSDSSAAINGVKVTYDDGTGTKRSVGPVGSTSTTETADLQDVSLSNPANQDGARHWLLLDAGITSAAGAKLIGQIKLADANANPWRGSVQIKGSATDDAGNTYPAARVRSGDYLIVEDDPDTRPRKVVQTSYSPNTVDVSCGQPPDRLDLLLSRLGVVLTGRL